MLQGVSARAVRLLDIAARKALASSHQLIIEREGRLHNYRRHSTERISGQAGLASLLQRSRIAPVGIKFNGG